MSSSIGNPFNSSIIIHRTSTLDLRHWDTDTLTK